MFTHRSGVIHLLVLIQFNGYLFVSGMFPAQRFLEFTLPSQEGIVSCSHRFTPEKKWNFAECKVQLHEWRNSQTNLGLEAKRLDSCCQVLTCDFVSDVLWALRYSFGMYSVISASLSLLFFSGKAGKQFCVRLFPCLTEGTFKPQRFSPEKNNVRHHWFSGQESSEDTTGTLLGLWVVRILEGTMQVCWDCGHKGHWYNIFCACCFSFVVKEDHIEWTVSCLSLEWVLRWLISPVFQVGHQLNACVCEGWTDFVAVSIQHPQHIGVPVWKAKTCHNKTKWQNPQIEFKFLAIWS